MENISWFWEVQERHRLGENSRINTCIKIFVRGFWEYFIWGLCNISTKTPVKCCDACGDPGIFPQPMPLLHFSKPGDVFHTVIYFPKNLSGYYVSHLIAGLDCSNDRGIFFHAWLPMEWIQPMWKLSTCDHANQPHIFSPKVPSTPLSEIPNIVPMNFLPPPECMQVSPWSKILSHKRENACSPIFLITHVTVLPNPRR